MSLSHLTTVVAGSATVRTRVRVPLRFADGYSTTADVVTFHDLADGREHLALGLGNWEAAVSRAALGGEAPLLQGYQQLIVVDPLADVAGEQLQAREEGGQRVEEHTVVAQGEQREQAVAVVAAEPGDALDLVLERR